jgi:hypothetical protein
MHFNMMHFLSVYWCLGVAHGFYFSNSRPSNCECQINKQGRDRPYLNLEASNDSPFKSYQYSETAWRHVTHLMASIIQALIVKIQE